MVNVGDMFYAQAADTAIQQKGECGGAVTATLKYLLENEVVDGVLAMKRGVDIYDGVPTLVTDPARITELSGSLHCAPVIQSSVLFKYLNGAQDMKLAVVGVGCDSLAMQVQIQKEELKANNLVRIGLNCGGTLPPVGAQEMIRKFYQTDPADVVTEGIAKGNFIIETKDHKHKEFKLDDLEEHGYGRRANCRRCEEKIPRTTDLAFGNWGVVGPDAGKAAFVEVCSVAGAKLLENAVSAGALTTKDPIPKGIEIRANVEKAMLKLAAKWQAHDSLSGEEREEFWLEQFAKCIKCGGCWKACPVCMCDDCKLESCEPRWVESGISSSPELQYARAAHMNADCVDCGQCEDACPVDIPLSLFFRQSTKNSAKLLARFDEITATRQRTSI
ncbi:MAG TPA: Coenzyme F420 hydrogenase/dehydrogenase, beta subunit C-terminal domain [Candidatus Acidoferrales bacterium]|nr:Coenzyme F420 hydrogenase/dehydrogenase, beta subunit C-terminal domain [Candidatus Acidoferrales bacterium]